MQTKSPDALDIVHNTNLKNVSSFRHDYVWLIALLSIYLVSMALIGEVNFPTNDDWNYGWTIRNFLETGRITFLVSIAPAYPLILSGALICKLFGFSFAALHSVSIGFALLAGVGAYACARELDIPKPIATLIAGTILLNPFTVDLSTAFMTDIPVVTFSCWYWFAIAKLLKKPDSTPLLMLASAFLCLAVSMRQSAIAFVFGSALLLAFTFKRLSKARLLSMSCLLILLPLSLGFFSERMLIQQMLYPHEIERLKIATSKQVHYWIHHPLKAVGEVITLNAKIFCYLGLFSIPLLPSMFLGRRSTESTDAKIKFLSLGCGFLAIGLPLIFAIVVQNQYMPYYWNLFYPPLFGSYGALSGSPALWTDKSIKIFTWVCVVLATLTASSLVYAMLSAKNQSTHSTEEEEEEFHKAQGSFPYTKSFLIIIVAVLGTMQLIAILQGKVQSYDRYLYPILVPMVIISSCKLSELKISKHVSVLSYILLMGLWVYSVLSTIDMINFNRAKWIAISRLEAAGFTERQIDGGPEYVLYRIPWLYKISTPLDQEKGWKLEYRGAPPRNCYRWWPVMGERFIIAGNNLDGYHRVDSVPYFSIWKFKTKEMMILEENNRSTSIFVPFDEPDLRPY